MRVFFWLSLAFGAVALPAGARPNFVVIFGEAQGWSSSSVAMDDSIPDSRNSLARTPSLQRLAEEGTRFARFYAASPRCTPTRAALMTGRSPAALHMTYVGESKKEELAEAGRRVIAPQALAELPESEVTLAELLKKNGYATAHFGKWHLGKANPGRHGFDENDGPNTNLGPEGSGEPNPKQAFEITRRGMDFMTRQVAAGHPFYLQVSHYAGNGDLAARPETYSEVRRRAKPSEDKRVDSTAMTEDMDATIGMLLERLDQLGIAGNTIVVYTADHGSKGHQTNAPLNSGKGTVMEGGIRVPLIIRGPGVLPGKCSHVPASTVDVFPTVAAFAGVLDGLPQGLEGGNLLPVLSGIFRGPVRRDRVEWVVHFPHYDKDPAGPASALVLGREKLIRFYETGALELYDIEQDLGEKKNLASMQPERARELDRMLSAYLNAVKAQMPVANSAFDPNAPPPSLKRGGRKNEIKP
jgi:arylsulfatase A